MEVVLRITKSSSTIRIFFDWTAAGGSLTSAGLSAREAVSGGTSAAAIFRNERRWLILLNPLVLAFMLSSHPNCAVAPVLHHKVAGCDSPSGPITSSGAGALSGSRPGAILGQRS